MDKGTCDYTITLLRLKYELGLPLEDMQHWRNHLNETLEKLSYNLKLHRDKLYI